MMNSDLPRRVTDARSNKNEQIVHAAEVLGRSTHRLAVFSAVYWHKKRVKTVTEIMERTGLPRVRVLQEGRKLVQQMIIGQTKAGGETAYEQDPFIQAHKRQILRLVAMPTELGAVPTKRNPASRNQDSGREQPRNAEAKFVAIDNIDSFALVNGVAPEAADKLLSEEQYKGGLQNILGEEGEFKDWGGEVQDLFTTRLSIDGQRRTAALALKGPATRGVLKPRHMGRNGDQIQRLFRSPASVFLIQYHGQIDFTVIEQMKAFALEKASQDSAVIYYGVIDGRDSRRLMAAYPRAFDSS